MDAVVAAVVTALLTGVGGYLWGNRRLRYERLYDRRANVLSRLGELLYEVQRGFVTFASPIQSSGVDRTGQMQEANRAFFELVHYFYSNEMWLDPETCLKVERFTDFAYLNMGKYVDQLDKRGYPKTNEGRTLGLRILGEIQPLRRELISEFRMILYLSRWYVRTAATDVGASRKIEAVEGTPPKILRKFTRIKSQPLATPWCNSRGVQGR